MNVYKARDLLKLPYKQLWEMPSEWHKIIFDDGSELITKDRFTKLSVLYWMPFKHHDAPILKEYHLGLDEKRITSKHLQEMLNRILWGIHEHSKETLDTEGLSKLILETQNILFNEVTTHIDTYESTLDLEDLHEVYMHPTIRKANDELVPTPRGIEEVAYPMIMSVVNDPTQLVGNVIIEGVRSGTQKQDGFLQAYGPRGFPTDINSDIFTTPVTTGYVDGIWNLHDNMVESRSGTKALLYNKELLRATEYFNRKMQLIAQYVMRLHEGDCGGHYLDFPVLKGNLKALEGAYYLNAKTNKVDWLRGTETELIGTKIQLRNTLGCIHPDPQGICSTCYGRLQFNVPKHANLGQIAAVVMGDKITSAVLSTKHTDATSSVEQYQIGDVEAKYLKEGKLDETLYLRQSTIDGGYKLLIKRTEVQNLADILMINDITEYPIENASEITKIGIVKDGFTEAVGDILTVSLYNRKASLSTSFLKYLKKHRWEIDDKDNVVIELKGYDVSKPFLTLPNKHVNMYEVMKRIQSFLHSGTDSDGIRISSNSVGYIGKTYLRNYKDPIEALAVTISLLNEKFHINAAHCSVLVYAMMCRITPHRDYRLPKPGISGGFERYNNLIMHRSLAGAMAYEKQHEPLNKPTSFLHVHRNDHPYDLALLGGLIN